MGILGNILRFVAILLIIYWFIGRSQAKREGVWWTMKYGAYMHMFLYLLLLIAGMWLSGANTTGWVMFESIEGKYRILMPEDPVEAPIPRLNPDGSRDTDVPETYTAMAMAGQALYLASYETWPDYIILPIINNNRVQSFLNLTRNAKLGHEGILISEEKISIDGFPGLEIEAEVQISNGDMGLTRTRFFLYGNRLYSWGVIYPRSYKLYPGAMSRVTKYLESFKLTWPNQ